MTDAAEQFCARCGVEWPACECLPSAPAQSTRDMVGPHPTILIDTREQLPLRFGATTRTERVLLPCGDYSLRGLSAEVAIERKSLADLTACCGKERARFIEQVERMRSYRFRALVVEARLCEVQIGAYQSRILPQSVEGTLVKVAHDYGVPVWMAEDAGGAAQLVERMLLREWKKARKR
jgi:ERCC4-type nuclease